MVWLPRSRRTWTSSRASCRTLFSGTSSSWKTRLRNWTNIWCTTRLCCQVILISTNQGPWLSIKTSSRPIAHHSRPKGGSRAHPWATPARPSNPQSHQRPTREMWPKLEPHFNSPSCRQLPREKSLPFRWKKEKTNTFWDITKHFGSHCGAMLCNSSLSYSPSQLSLEDWSALTWWLVKEMKRIHAHTTQKASCIQSPFCGFLKEEGDGGACFSVWNIDQQNLIETERVIWSFDVVREKSPQSLKWDEEHSSSLVLDLHFNWINKSFFSLFAFVPPFYHLLKNMGKKQFFKKLSFSFSFIAEQAGRTKLGIQRRWIEIRSQRRLGYLRSRDTTNRNRWKVRKDLFHQSCVLLLHSAATARISFWSRQWNSATHFLGNQHTQTLPNFSPLFLYLLRVGQSKQEPCLLFIIFQRIRSSGVYWHTRWAAELLPFILRSNSSSGKILSVHNIQVSNRPTWGAEVGLLQRRMK